jgi:RNA polymerase sigma-70 factor (ECF subfamily)
MPPAPRRSIPAKRGAGNFRIGEGHVGKVEVREDSENEDEGLVRASQAGQVGAFNQLVSRYERQVYGLTLRMLGDREAAADAAQDAFLAAFQGIRKLRGQNFRAWLLRIAINASYDQLRRRQRRPASSLDALQEALGDALILVDRAESPAEAAERAELGAAIQAGLLTLPPDQRATVILSDVHGCDYAEVAAATNSSLGTVKSRLSRGRARLRDYLLARGELLGDRYRLTKSEAG